MDVNILANVVRLKDFALPAIGKAGIELIVGGDSIWGLFKVRGSDGIYG